MSDARYIIEISTTQTIVGVVHTEKVGDLYLTTTDPVAAVEFRKSLRSMMADTGYDLKLVMEESKRSGVITAFDEDHFRKPRRPDRSDGVARVVETPGAAPGFDTAMNEAGAAMKTLTRLDNWLAGDAGKPSDREFADMADTLDYYEISTPYLRSCFRTQNHMAVAEYLMILKKLSSVVRAFPIECVAPVDEVRFQDVWTELRQQSPDARSKPDAKACEQESDLDFACAKGRIVEVCFVNGYDLGTNDQNDHVAGLDEAPYRVVIVGADATPSQWNDDTLDPKWDVIPAPDETRLDGLRSLWTFGPSYRDATLSQKEG